MPNQRYAYPKKDRYIKIFKIRKRRPANQKAYITVKEYIHPKNESLHAYVRQLTAKEILAENLKDTSTYLVVINYHPEVDMDCYIEFNGKVLRVITPPDTYEDRNIEMKLTCQIVTDSLEYSKTVGKEKLL